MTKKTSDETVTVNDLIDHVAAQGAQYDYNTDEFDTAVKQLERLHKLLPDNKGKRVSADALLAAGANLAGLLLVLNFERAGVITSKAFSLIMKSR